jgi:flavin-dependent dehydrogenase
MSDLPVVVIGGGPAGLMSAIHLARCDRAVSLYDRPRTSNRRSVHTSRFDLGRTCDYLDIDLTGCFQRVISETIYFYGRRLIRQNRTYACERGSGRASLDCTLRRIAIQTGVNIVERRVTIDDAISHVGPTIIATGLSPDFYHRLDIGHIRISGHEARIPYSNEVTLTSYKNGYTNEDFAYMASINGIIYTLLFSRNGLDTDSLSRYQEELRQTTGLEFPKWNRFEGYVPTRPRLTSDDFILAGTLAGVIDPFFLSGVVAALVSGKVAADAVLSPQHARREYDRLVKYFGVKRNLHRLMQGRILPGRAKFAVIALHTFLGDVGKV